ncbi:MAG: hypothetical protein J07HX64_00715 [halophilic archaeon J07HX64]|jgi:hypothetical protein|nr:MAG: hypothetical protein J07HX64_00715 [halophilic archaeon J07HX64]
MLRDAVDSPGEQTPEELREIYDELLVETVRTVGPDEVTEAPGVDEQQVDALLADESPSLTLEEAAAILAASDDRPDADTVAAEARDILLMGMSMAVLDVEALASGIDDRMDPKEIQQKVEGRYPMALDEYAVMHSYIEQRR